ncbi:hypothetical protein [Pseudomonas fluorescens]|uniref:hypothetical protein n=1 Tax=Pseudomonas fluorescens TaxID=294 RepID=UPI001397074B|nr:hypothetical protein [Pseudomonas fluorescens]QIA01005.1 hypothetical protein GZH78_02380 [Pseudomonas fluorescens]
MIFDSLIEESLKSVHGLLTRQRLAIFTIAIFLIAPKNIELVETIQNNPSISELTNQFTSTITTLPAITTTLLALVVFYLSAILHQKISNTSQRFTIKKLNKIVDTLKELELQKNDFFITRELEIKILWKSEKEEAEKEIRRTSAFSELFISASVTISFLSTLEIQSILIAALIAVCSILYSIETSRKSLVLYLTHIATYKIAITRLNAIKKCE